jgi:hypothetical protein
MRPQNIAHFHFFSCLTPLTKCKFLSVCTQTTLDKAAWKMKKVAGYEALVKNVWGRTDVRHARLWQ